MNNNEEIVNKSVLKRENYTFTINTYFICNTYFYKTVIIFGEHIIPIGMHTNIKEAEAIYYTWHKLIHDSPLTQILELIQILAKGE